MKSSLHENIPFSRQSVPWIGGFSYAVSRVVITAPPACPARPPPGPGPPGSDPAESLALKVDGRKSSRQTKKAAINAALSLVECHVL